MTIRTTTLGGTDWTSAEDLTSADLNDTINEMANYAKTLSGFWKNANLYTVFDDFESYTSGVAVPATKWTYTDDPTYSSDTSFTTETSTIAAGTDGGTKEGLLSATGPDSDISHIATALVYTNGLTANAHTHCHVAVKFNGTLASGSSYKQAHISFDGGTNWDVLLSSSSSYDSGTPIDVGPIIFEILVIAQGSNEYDCYINGKFIRTVTDASFELGFRVKSANNNNDSNTTALMYIDNVYQSQGIV